LAKKKTNLRLTEKDLQRPFWFDLPIRFYERVKGTAVEMGFRRNNSFLAPSTISLRNSGKKGAEQRCRPQSNRSSWLRIFSAEPDRFAGKT